MFGPAIVGVAILLYAWIVFVKQSKQITWQRVMVLILIEIGVGVACAWIRTEFLLKNLIGLDNIPEDLFASTIRGSWLPNLIAFICVVLLYAIVRYGEKREKNVGQTQL